MSSSSWGASRVAIQAILAQGGPHVPSVATLLSCQEMRTLKTVYLEANRHYPKLSSADHGILTRMT